MQEGPPAHIAGFDPHPAGHAGYLYGVSGVALGELLFYLPGFLPGQDASRSWTVNAARRTPAPVRRAVHPVPVVR